MSERQRFTVQQHHSTVVNCSAILFACRMYFYGEYKAEDQEEMLEKLDKKVSEVYTRCIGPNDANIP